MRRLAMLLLVVLLAAGCRVLGAPPIPSAQERAAYGDVVWEETRKLGNPPHEGPAHTYVEWAADEGELLRLEIDRVLEELAAGFAASVFEGTAPPEK
jgi:hypothetical protein